MKASIIETPKYSIYLSTDSQERERSDIAVSSGAFSTILRFTDGKPKEASKKWVERREFKAFLHAKGTELKALKNLPKETAKRLEGLNVKTVERLAAATGPLCKEHEIAVAQGMAENHLKFVALRRELEAGPTEEKVVENEKVTKEGKKEKTNGNV